MKHSPTMALLLTLGAAGAYAQQFPVLLAFSGDGSPSAVDLKHPDTNTGEENLAGAGTLGAFTLRLIKASTSTPQPSTSCAGPTMLYFPNVVGAGVFRFLDGSLLKVNLTGGGDCIDFAANQAQCTMTFEITGGTGRFQGASGLLTLTETATPMLIDGSSPPNPVLFTEVGEIRGTISRSNNSTP